MRAGCCCLRRSRDVEGCWEWVALPADSSRPAIDPADDACYALVRDAVASGVLADDFVDRCGTNGGGLWFMPPGCKQASSIRTDRLSRSLPVSANHRESAPRIYPDIRSDNGLGTNSDRRRTGAWPLTHWSAIQRQGLCVLYPAVSYDYIVAFSNDVGDPLGVVPGGGGLFFRNHWDGSLNLGEGTGRGAFSVSVTVSVQMNAMTLAGRCSSPIHHLNFGG